MKALSSVPEPVVTYSTVNSFTTRPTILPFAARPVVARPAAQPSTKLSAQPTQPTAPQPGTIHVAPWPTADQPTRSAGVASTPTGLLTSTQPSIVLPTSSTQHSAFEHVAVPSTELPPALSIMVGASAPCAVDAGEMKAVEGEGEVLEESGGSARAAKLRRLQGLGGGVQAVRKQCGTPGCFLVSRPEHTSLSSRPSPVLSFSITSLHSSSINPAPLPKPLAQPHPPTPPSPPRSS